MLSMQMTKFHKSGKWRNNKKLIYNTFIKKNLWQLNYFLLFASKTKLNQFSFLWNILLNYNIKPRSSKNLQLCYENCKLLFLNKNDQCLSWPQRFEKKYLLIIVNINRLLWIHLQTIKYRYTMRNKIGFPLEIIVNVFECLTVSLVPLKLLLWQWRSFCFLSVGVVWICYGVI